MFANKHHFELKQRTPQPDNSKHTYVHTPTYTRINKYTHTHFSPILYYACNSLLVIFREQISAFFHRMHADFKAFPNYALLGFDPSRFKGNCWRFERTCWIRLLPRNCRQHFPPI